MPDENVKLMHRGVGESIRTWTLDVCQGCGKPHGPRDRWASCPAPGFSHGAGGDLHDTERVEVVEADLVPWAHDCSQVSAKKWRDAHDALCEVLERIRDLGKNNRKTHADISIEARAIARSTLSDGSETE